MSIQTKLTGGTHIADSLARALSEKYSVKLVESDPDRAKKTAQHLHDSEVEVYNADPVDMNFMKEENIDSTDLYIAATPKDETNIMSSLIVLSQEWNLSNPSTLRVVRF